MIYAGDTVTPRPGRGIPGHFTEGLPYVVLRGGGDMLQVRDNKGRKVMAWPDIFEVVTRAVEFVQMIDAGSGQV